MILSKGCRSLNLCYSIILGSLNSNTKSQLRVLKLRQSKDLRWPAFNKCCYCDCESFCDCYENTGFIKALLSSCSSLRHLVIEDVFLSQNMAESICKNGKTLQILNLNRSDLDIEGDLNDFKSYWQEIIKCCQELKEVDLAHQPETGTGGLTNGDLDFLVRNIPPKIEKLNLCSSLDDHIKILLSRCNEIKALALEATCITDDSLKTIRQQLNLTLEELSLGPDDRDTISLEPYERDMVIRFRQANPPRISFTGFLELKSMPRLKILNFLAVIFFIV